ncbi:hypothetical protein N7530_011382 [Penicillium desertorum]|uniref:Uncharacterized protein n=1 Tax=Penicillium desertorum TaxID=1303715 RepID=A0A9X0BHG0_9EURO|nr:hypothetical protein N7530_011382 [Penicillium desertorum]
MTQITKWADFARVSEEFDSENEFQYTMFTVIKAISSTTAYYLPAKLRSRFSKSRLPQANP